MATQTLMDEAKQRYMEQYGDALVTNAYLKIALALLSLAVVGLVILNVKTIYIFRNFKPLVIRIDKLGRAQAVSYDSFAYKPQAIEARYFLTQFCELYYRRNRYTINDDFSKALYFLDGKLASDIMQQDKQKKTIQNFLNDPSAPEVDIDVQQVAIDPMIKAPYRASVDFYRIEYSTADHSMINKTLCTASFVFTFHSPVPNRLVPINPLGLTILDFREDEAFTTKTNQEQ
jgi:type IV secretion system protein VirB5